MKTFNEFMENFSQDDVNLMEKMMAEKENSLYENESENDMMTFHEMDMSEIINEYGDMKIKDIDEGLVGKILGGITGFTIGPSIGRVVANSLGVEKGIFYDMFNSRLVGAALGSAITKYIGSSKR